jgi:tetratricopeptide (TPR) repeat protein
VDKNPRTLWSIAFLAVLLVVLYLPKFKTSSGNLGKAKNGMETSQALPQEIVSREEFLNAVFTDSRPPEWMGKLLFQSLPDLPKDTLQKALKWASETQNKPLLSFIQSSLAEMQGGEENLTTAARNLIFGASESIDNPVVAAYMFQQGKRLLDTVLKINSKNIPARNALIVYQSEYENQPMKFLGTLRETIALDSNNLETRFLRLNLLRKSAQWKKAAEECQKLISLQPQNPVWYFQASDIYGFMGDSVNARVYLNLAVKVQKSNKIQ